MNNQQPLWTSEARVTYARTQTWTCNDTGLHEGFLCEWHHQQECACIVLRGHESYCQDLMPHRSMWLFETESDSRGFVQLNCVRKSSQVSMDTRSVLQTAARNSVQCVTLHSKKFPSHCTGKVTLREDSVWEETYFFPINRLAQISMNPLLCNFKNK